MFGQDPYYIFSVKIGENKNISYLKEVIKEKKKPAYDHVVTDTLKIWNVSIAADDDKKVQLKVKGKKPLLPVKKLWQVFQANLTMKMSTLL